VPESEWTSQLRRGVLELCVLRVLRDQPSYGYEIVTTLSAFGPLAAGENTLYPLLRRLKTDKYLETYAVDSPTGPPRQYYRITARGRQRLTLLETEWTDMAAAIARCLNGGSP
jgi:PadR family transcriptional regulator PadR